MEKIHLELNGQMLHSYKLEFVHPITGKKLELHFNGEMTIEEFNKAFCATFNAIPEMLDDKRYPYPSNFKLSRLGIEGDQVFSLPSHAMVFRFIREFKKKYGIYTDLKYATRQWTHIDSTVAFSDFHRLPSLWYSIKEAILYKIAIKLYRS